jgi:uncharacterized protein (DUF1330 family)
MAAYLISDVGAVAPEDEEAWKAYLAMAPATIQKYGGRYLARGAAIDVIEGDWSPCAIVIAEFPDREAVRHWYASPEYAEGLKIRASSGLHRKMICVEGSVDPSPDKLLGPEFVRVSKSCADHSDIEKNSER